MKRRFRFRKIHGYGLALLVVLSLPFLWVIVAYGALPMFWTHHEHKKHDPHVAIVSYTHQDIPADPINLRLTGEANTIACILGGAGWQKADPVSLNTSFGIVGSVLFKFPYTRAPVSPLFVDGRPQDFAFEHLEGASADKRHHVRFWQIGPHDWYAAGTFDRGVGVSLFTLQVTHHIGPDIDRDRDAIADILHVSGAVEQSVENDQLANNKVHRNGGGDKYYTDGRIRTFVLPIACKR